MHDDFKPKTKILHPNPQGTVFNEMSFTDILEDKEAILAVLGQKITDSDVVIFIKGTGERPMCGYSKMMVELVKFYQVPTVEYVNVFQSDVLRQTCKNISDQFYSQTCLLKYISK